MKDESAFIKRIEELVSLGREQGGKVSKEQVEEAAMDLNLPVSGLNAVYEYLHSKKIGIEEALDIEEALSEEDRNYLELYIEELKELTEYSEGEKEAHYISAMAGHLESQTKVIEIMLPQVVDIARLYTDQGVPIEDLIGEGNVALSAGVTMLGALESGKEVPGALASMVMNAMEQLIGEESDIRGKDQKIVSKVNKVADAARELAQDLGRKVTVEELMAETKLSRKTIEDAIRFSGQKIEDIDGQ